MEGLWGLSNNIWVLFGIIAFLLAAFILDWLRADIVALIVLVLLGYTNLVPYQTLFSGFSSDAVISLIGIMMIGAGLESSGIVRVLAKWGVKRTQDHESRVMFLLMFSAGLLSGVMRSVGSVALLLPILNQMSRRTGLSKARLLIPMGFCAILGSTLTMVGSGPLILLNGLLEHSGGLVDAWGHSTKPFTLFAVFPVGATLLVIGLLYFRFGAKYLLPASEPRSRLSQQTTALAHFNRVYGIGSTLIECRLPHSSHFVNQTLLDLEHTLESQMAVVAIRQGDQLFLPPRRNIILKDNTLLVILGPKEAVEAWAKEHGVKVLPKMSDFSESLHPMHAGVGEMVIPPGSHLVGFDLRKLYFRRVYNLQVLAVYRGEKVFRGQELLEVTLKAGDTLGIFCSWEALARFKKQIGEGIVVITDFPQFTPYTHKEVSAALITLCSLGLVLSGFVPVTIGFMMGAIAMIVFKVLTMDEAYNAISWRTIFLLAGLIPLGTAVEQTGAARWVVEIFNTSLVHYPSFVVMGILAVVATTLGLIISNVGATVLLVPIAVQLALAQAADPRMYALVVALSTSNTFILPTHQANALIAWPGRYTTADFFKAGSVLTLLYWAGIFMVLPFMMR